MGLAASRQEAFWEACGFGHIERAKNFLKEGEIDVNWVSYVNDSCPIHVASQGKPDIVDLLIANNCDVSAKDGRGNLAIHHAAMKGHADIVQKLIDAGSEINVQEKNGWTALHNAAYWCHPEVVNVLLKHNCDVSIRNKDERTPLHECARSQTSDDCRLGKVAKLLIDSGSDVDVKSSDWGEVDLTALMYAAFHNHPSVANALIDARCDIDAIGTTYWTALHWAADRGHDELVYVLLEAGADPTKRDLKGETALDRAGTENIKEVLTTAIQLHKDLQLVNRPVIQPVTSLRKPVIPYVPKCDPKFKSQSLLPTSWTTSKIDVKNLINEKKARLAAKTSQTYRQELARRTGTNIITNDAIVVTKLDNLRIDGHEEISNEDLGGSDVSVENKAKSSEDVCDTEPKIMPSTEELGTTEASFSNSNLDISERPDNISFDCYAETDQESTDNRDRDVAHPLVRNEDCETDLKSNEDETDKVESVGKERESDDRENVNEEVKSS